jgi:hypothetical protein
MDDLVDDKLNASTEAVAGSHSNESGCDLDELCYEEKPNKSLTIIDAGCTNRYNNILFEPEDDLSKYYSNVRYCKFCRQIESDKVKFFDHRKFICRKCASRESNFCRVRNVLVRAFKRLNVDVNTAIDILKEERDKIYKDLPNRREKVIIK